jgi:hypothetical protein
MQLSTNMFLLLHGDGLRHTNAVGVWRTSFTSVKSPNKNQLLTSIETEYSLADISMQLRTHNIIHGHNRNDNYQHATKRNHPQYDHLYCKLIDPQDCHIDNCNIMNPSQDATEHKHVFVFAWRRCSIHECSRGNVPHLRELNKQTPSPDFNWNWIPYSLANISMQFRKQNIIQGHNHSDNDQHAT